MTRESEIRQILESMTVYEMVIIGYESGFTYGENGKGKKYGYLDSQKGERIKLIRELRKLKGVLG